MGSILPRHELDVRQSLASTPALNDEELSNRQIYLPLKDAEQRIGSALEGPSKVLTTQNQSFT
jgi:hypothetical protein